MEDDLIKDIENVLYISCARKQPLFNDVDQMHLGTKPCLLQCDSIYVDFTDAFSQLNGFYIKYFMKIIYNLNSNNYVRNQ